MWRAMIGKLTVRWAVTALFGASLAAYAYLAVSQRDRWSCAVNHLLHLAMSAAMILMVWRVGLGLPAVAPTLFFLLAGAWFVFLAVRASAESRERLKTCYYAAMMAAMAWMYALMSSGTTGAHAHGHSASDSVGANMPGMRLPEHPASPGAGGFSWVAAANLLGALGFAALAVYWLYRFVGQRRLARVPARLARMEPLYQAFTAAGTALMFDTLLW
ncbi:DUF5134 domain-containing protein [Mycobacterium avium subsp. hominissuis]|nr:hypothetical protein MAH_0110 [Mycobacterium avium subsp. hominissuis TH135]